MNYQAIQPPFSLDFWEMSKDELKAYFAWVMAIIPDRIHQLTAFIKDDPAFRNWESDNSESSIDILGEWMSAHVSVRERTDDELGALKDKSQYSIDPPKDVLTRESYSIGFDVGLYFAQTLIAHHPNLKWTQDFRSRKDMDFGQPLLTPFGPLQLNPIRIAINVAHGLARKQRPATRLREVYEEWSRRAA